MAGSVKKLLIVPWFGDLPPWIDYWIVNTSRALNEHGYTIHLDQDLAAFKRRVKRRLGVDAPIVAGEGKVHDYRCALAALYPELLDGFDFWGHTDLDMVYGHVHSWVTDEFLAELDIHSNHVDYISGPWTLYRNNPGVNHLFLDAANWRERLTHPDATGWVEKGFTEVVDAAHARGDVRLRYTMWQTRNLDSFTTCRLAEDGRLFEGKVEIPMLHFRRTKEYPAGCIPS